MSIHAVLGAQWGDEGKGKLVHALSENYDIVARYQGGANAGHTIVIGQNEFIFHQVPSGILYPNKQCLIGNGCVVDPFSLVEEIDRLDNMGLYPEKRLKIAYNAHIVTSLHKKIDEYQESLRSEEDKIGTTHRGIGPTYMDKISRGGFRMIDLFDLERFGEKFTRLVSDWNKQHPEFSTSSKEWLDSIAEYRDRFAKMIDDVSEICSDAIREGKKILAEGAQGSLLDIDHGTFPFVTSSNPTVGGAVTGLGVPPQSIRRITGVFKAYTTRVGAGPFPTELTGEEGDLLRQIGMEYGATTGRSRRCGWFDGIAAKYATKLNGFTDIAITKMDILDPYEEIQICTGYHRNKVKKFPFALQNPEAIDPQYQSLSGWRDSTVGITKFEELPTKAMEYIKFIENYLGVNVSLISTGSDSQHLIQIF